MTIFRFKLEALSALIAISLLVSCSRGADERELQELRSRVEELEAHSGTADQMTGYEEENDANESPTPTSAPQASTFPTLSPDYRPGELSERIEHEDLKRSVKDLERQVELDRINRDIEQQRLRDEQRRRDQNRLLGLEN